MFNNLDTTNFRSSILFYDVNFEEVLSKITICYHKMTTDHSTIKNDENAIRNILLLKYLKNDEIRKEVGLIGCNFEREVQEDESQGRTDIKITSINSFLKQKAFYTIECKRLNNKNTSGKTGLNAEYVSNGIKRFTSNYYSSFYEVSAMIGFIVEKMDIHKNTEKINTLLIKDDTIITTKSITKSTFIKDFEHHYHSEHNMDKHKLIIYHLMFDFSENILH